MDRGDGDGFFRPTQNPDAQPAASSADEVIAGDDAEPDDTPATATQYDFYKLLSADDVPMTDAELAATERAEAERRQRAADELAHVAKVPAPTAGNDAPYLLQAGAFGASGDAEAVKARIALLGLTARVESATIEGKTVYRVRLGPYGTASELAEAKRKLAGAGLQTLAIKVK